MPVFLITSPGADLGRQAVEAVSAEEAARLWAKACGCGPETISTVVKVSESGVIREEE